MNRLLCGVVAILSSTSAIAQREVDIFVYGATSAGIIAGYTAKKLGKSVVIIEPGYHPGGMSTGGLGQTDIGNKVAITGWSRDFYKRVGKKYGKDEQWIFEPHVAEDVFNSYIREADLEVLYGSRVVSLRKDGKKIVSAEIRSSATGTSEVRAKMFIDCTYEGDLIPLAGVSYTVGRESNSQYGETYNGVQLLDKHQFPDGIDPYRTPGHSESGLLWGISASQLQSNGSGDKNIQAYNFRLCLTSDPSNQIPVTRPDDYDSTRYELLLRQIQKASPDSLNWQLMHIAPMPNHKTDINNCGGFSSDMIGMNAGYVDGSPEERNRIVKAHESYTKGWLYFIGHDARVPIKLRNEMLQWGYPRDEFQDNNNFTRQLYIREARRMIGDYVMTQRNCQGTEVVRDGVGLAAYTMDSHNCQRLVVNGMVKNEGDVQVGGFGPYPVSYRALIPKAAECSNLLVPVCLSASHIAYGSIRMEPVFMVLAQSCATAASLAIDGNSSVQKVSVKKIRSLLK